MTKPFRIRLGRATGDEMASTLDNMAHAAAEDPARAQGLAALAALRQASFNGPYVFESSDAAAIAALRTAAVSLDNTDGYGPDEALQWAAMKRSAARVLRQIAAWEAA